MRNTAVRMARAHRIPRSAILLVLAALFAAFSCAEAGASTAGQPAIGVYTGPADRAAHDSFSALLGNEATYALDFVDASQSWTTIASGSDWLLDPWASWVRAKAGRRLVISVPMLNQASSGRLADGAAGAFDSYFRTLAQEIADKGLGDAVIRLGWEANGDWYPWKASTDPTAWKAFFRRIVGVMRAVQPKVSGQPRQAFEFLLTYNRGTSGTAIKFATIYPGDDVVGLLGLDVYDYKWLDTTSTPEVRWSDALNQEMGLADFKAFAASHGKPMSIPEWGLAQKGWDDNGGVGDNPYFVDRMADWFAANAATLRYQSYFDHASSWTGDHRLASYVNAQARYRARLGLLAPPRDASAPSVSVTAPAAGATVRATITLSASASDGGGVAGVRFRLNGADIATEDRYAPFAIGWDTRSKPNGRYTLTAVARDVAGNARISASRTITIGN
jgi:Big-like domain-containing protein/glycosyl hydrolase family 26